MKELYKVQAQMFVGWPGVPHSSSCGMETASARVRCSKLTVDVFN